MKNLKKFETVQEVHAELDRLDALLGAEMNRFDEKKSPAEFRETMANCEALAEQEAETRAQLSRFK